ncbi:hypothetical protein FORMB_12990 [Formosa sp. Hel1_33_131]|uniref:O-antigen ligase family protein n=1 Tax=Formosa sp. Hel1_33_131 TaxID=1336794 RepID=UPI00084E36CA|nr:O-antigen ligase family protein [Formosa sp. Hel1_33_131]AOR28343.1 hypothetical protein FORMB_12990 [Formosa sp. Hel1_33_131]
MIDKIKEYLLPFLISITPIVAVFASAKFLSLFLFCIGFIYLFEKNKVNALKGYKMFFKPYLVFVIFCIVSTIISKDIHVSIKTLERYISLIVVPIIIFSTNFSEKRYRFLLKSFVLSLLIISIFSVFKLIWFVNVYSDWIEVMRGVNENDTYVQFKYPHLMWDVHPSYWSYLMLVAVIILFSNKYFNSIFKKQTVIVLLILFIVNLFYLAARLPLLIFIVISIVYLFNYYKSYKIITGVLFLFFLFIITAYYNFPFLEYKIKLVLTDDRFFLWNMVYDNIKPNHLFFGEGLGLSGDFIANILKSSEDTRIDYTGVEIHNQYLTMLLETGIVGVIVLLYLYVKPVIILMFRKKSYSLPLLAIVLLTLFASTLEPFFTVIKGIIIFTIFSSLFSMFHEKYKT